MKVWCQKSFEEQKLDDITAREDVDCDHYPWHNVNILPILMTAVNIVSAFVYLKERPIKDKVQPLLLASSPLSSAKKESSVSKTYSVFRQVA